MSLEFEGSVGGSARGDSSTQRHGHDRFHAACTDVARMKETLKFFQRNECLPPGFLLLNGRDDKTPVLDRETLDKIGKDLYELIKQNKDAKFGEAQLKMIADHLGKAYADGGMPNVIIEERKILKALNEAIKKYFRLHSGMSVEKCPFVLERVFDPEFPEKRRWVFKEKLEGEKIKEHFKETIDVRGTKK